MLVLSLFPGLGFLDYAFEQEGFTILRGPDVIWGGDIRRFHPPAGVFGGVIGGPPCQSFSALVHLVRNNGNEPKFGNLIPEFERCVSEAQPEWFVMENVPAAPAPRVQGLPCTTYRLADWECGGNTTRERSISFGSGNGAVLPLDVYALRPSVVEMTVVGGDGPAPGQRDKLTYAITGNSRHVPAGQRVRREAGPGFGSLVGVPDMLRTQGFPRDMLDHCPFTTHGKRQAVGNAVPLAMGLAIAKAVKKAMCADAT
jgi:DNA (cytosine-5)-methyltransferase 1